jgi:hypothetical protein
MSAAAAAAAEVALSFSRYIAARLKNQGMAYQEKRKKKEEKGIIYLNSIIPLSISSNKVAYLEENGLL